VPLRLSASTSYARYRKFGIRGGDFNCTPDGLAQGRGSIPRKPFLPVSASSDSFRLPRTTSSVISFNVPERRGRTRSQLPIHIHIQHTSINITFNSGAVRAENPPATKFIYALCHCGQLIGRRAVGLQGGSGSRALLHGRFYPLLWLRWFLHSIRWTGGTVRQAPRLEPRRRPILTQTVTATLPPPTQPTSFKLPALALGAGMPTARPMGHGQLGDRGPACSAAFRHLRSVFGASHYPGSMLPNVFDLFWRVLGANHFGAPLV
jgi:hypothetical protein